MRKERGISKLIVIVWRGLPMSARPHPSIYNRHLRKFPVRIVMEK
jgi:hypothetical protein